MNKMRNRYKKKHTPIRRLSALLAMVVLFFLILAASYLLGGAVLYFLMEKGMISLAGGRNFLVILLFLLIVSLGIGTIFSVIGGTIFLHPLRQLIEGTKEIAAGNFDFQVHASGPYEMQRLTHSFNEMAKELGSIETLQNDFVNNVSHEFKTPVASIRGFARLLKQDNISTQQKTEYLNIILLEAERMAQLTDNVLLLSKLDNNLQVTALESFAVDEQLRQVILGLHPLLEKKNIELAIQLQSASLLGSKDLLNHVWVNLMNNAIKFTEANGVIQVSVIDQPESVTVIIADNGIGMSKEVQQRLFDKFYQGDLSHASQGNGLGLSLVQRIVALSGGTIRVESEVGQGSSFLVCLPKKVSSAE